MCAASVRGALQKIDGVADIQTDVEGRKCSFKLSDPDASYKDQLAEMAKTNEHLTGYSIL